MIRNTSAERFAGALRRRPVLYQAILAALLVVLATAGCAHQKAYEKGLKLHYDGPNMKVTNLPEANKYIRGKYREGWTL